MALSPIAISSCSLEDNDEAFYDVDSGYNALVTVKALSSGQVYFQLDDSTTVEPIDFNYTFSDELRALCKLDSEGESENFSFSARVPMFKEILTKKALDSTDEDNASILAKQDPVNVYPDWITVCEDGYLTIHFASQWGISSNTHIVNLVKVSDNPCSFRFCHDKNSDYGTNWANGIAAFKISELIPSSEEDYIDFNLSWQSFDGEKTMTFKYKAR